MTAHTERELQVDGKTSTLYLARPASGAGAAVVVLHPWWGLNDDVRAFADRLAGAGFIAAAPDLFRGKVAATIEEAERLSKEIDEDVGDAAAIAAADWLMAETGSQRVASVGFSMGAMWAVWLAGLRPQVVASVTYYGAVWGRSANGKTRLTESRAPILAHFAEADEYESEEGITAFERGCRAMGREIEIVRYPGTNHWFAEPSQATYAADAADLAFERTVAFLKRHLGDT